jgi:hypothetical protein
MISQDLVTAVCHLQEPVYSEDSKLACIDQYVNCSVERSGQFKESAVKTCIEQGGRILNYDY